MITQPDPALQRLSIRAQSWIGVVCVRKYCRDQSIHDEHIDAFCELIEALGECRNLLAWNTLGRQLRHTGLGDTAPADQSLAQMLEWVRDISASQLYGAWQPGVASLCLQNSMALAGLTLLDIDLLVLSAHDPSPDGWGRPIDTATSKRWIIMTSKIAPSLSINFKPRHAKP